MGLLSRDEFLQKVKLKHEDVDVPELGEGAQVRIREMTSGERDEFESEVLSAQEGGKSAKAVVKGMRSRLLAKTAVDADGERLFSEGDWKLIAQNQSARVVERLFFKALELSGLSEERLEEAVGESGAARPSDSDSD